MQYNYMYTQIDTLISIYLYVFEKIKKKAFSFSYTV